MGWQAAVADTALELDGDELAYSDVVVTTPRQQGKSVLMLAVLVHRMLWARHQRVLFGAQSRLVARSRLLDSWWPLVRRSRLRALFSVSRGTGMEALRCSNGSMLTLLSSDESAGHGESIDLAVLDECWSHDSSTELAVRPTLLTRPSSQLWLVSTMGHERSVWWHEKCRAGRTAATSGLEGTCYFEWSADPAADPGDPETWRSCMPALGVTCDERKVAKDLAAMPPAEFKRCYLNLMPEEADAGWRVFSRELFEEMTR
jgi:phage terminase large subunit-like protein